MERDESSEAAGLELTPLDVVELSNMGIAIDAAMPDDPRYRQSVTFDLLEQRAENAQLRADNARLRMEAESLMTGNGLGPLRALVGYVLVAGMVATIFMFVRAAVHG
ncbi:MAG TPA: hypothetical protein VN841_02545 [Bryobacteraceae bacterium]|nr:hypothetical protein [Bryobacteraceae bacterium]